MRLNRLEVTDFRSIRSAEVDLKRVNWVLGDNFSGKTSLLRAIESALLARASSFVVNAEAKSAKVSLDVQAGPREVNLTLKRFRSKVAPISVNGNTQPRGGYLKAMPEILGVSAKVLESVLSSGGFMSMDATGQASLILAASGVTHEWADAEAAFKDWCEEQDLDHFRLDSLLETVRLSGLDLIDAIKADAYGQRTLANKQAALEQHPPPEPPPAIIQYVRSPGLLEALRDESRALLDRLPRLQQQAGWLAQIEDETDPSVELNAIDQTALKAAADDLRARRAAVSESDSVVRGCTSTRDTALATHTSLASAKCPFGVKCDFKEWAPEEWAAIERSLVASEEALQVAVNARALLAGVTKTELDHLRGERTRIDDLRKKVAVRESVLNKIAGADGAALRLEVDQVAGRSKVVTTLLDAVKAHKRASEKHGEAVFRRDRAAKLANQLDTIVKGFERPIRYKMVDDVLDRFVKPMTMALKLFVGDNFVFKASASSGFSLEVMKKGMALPYSELSESEKLMVSTAAQHAIATLAGAEILIVDAVDTLRGAALQRFIRGLYVIAKGYKTVVVASTTGRIRPESSPLRGKKSFPSTQLMVIRDGVLEVLPQLSEEDLQAV